MHYTMCGLLCHLNEEPPQTYKLPLKARELHF